MNRLIPIDVVGLTSGISAVTSRWNHACALTASKGVKCWGWNAYGQLGAHAIVSSPVPIDVIGFP